MHLFAYTANVGPGSNQDVPALIDSVVAISNTHAFLNATRVLKWAYASGANLTGASIQSPSIRTVTKVGIEPINAALLPVNNPNIADFTGRPITLPKLEEIQLIINDAVGTTEQVFGLLEFGGNDQPAPSGTIYEYHGTISTAAVANKWTLQTVTWDTILPQGVFAVVGGRLFSTTGIAFRVVFHGQTDRPGGLAINSVGNRAPYIQRNGYLGQWGTFEASALPYIEVLCNAADASQDVILDIVRIA